MNYLLGVASTGIIYGIENKMQADVSCVDYFYETIFWLCT